MFEGLPVDVLRDHGDCDAESHGWDDSLLGSVPFVRREKEVRGKTGGGMLRAPA